MLLFNVYIFSSGYVETEDNKKNLNQTISDLKNKLFFVYLQDKCSSIIKTEHSTLESNRKLKRCSTL